MFFGKNTSLKLIIYLTILLFSNNISSSELIIPITKYLPLSKTLTIPIPGSSNVIIDQKNIRQHSSMPIHDIIELESGIKSRSIYGSNSSGSKTTLDIRGMGAQSKSNVLILVNGQRLNNIDMSEIDFPSIPAESIDKVEIIKGNAASVLYGDGAIGGAINIITKPAIIEEPKNQVTLKSGSFKFKELDWNYAQKLDQYSFNTYFNHMTTDGYRDNNEQQQSNVTSELRYSSNTRDHFLQFSLSDQNMNTPGDRSQNQIYTDRKGTDTPNDYIKSDGLSVLYGSNYKINGSLNFILDSSFRMKDSYSDLQSTSFPSYNETFLKNYQITPRLNNLSTLTNKNLNSTYGLDLQYADYYSHRKKNQTAIPLHVYDAWQSSLSLYTQQSLQINDKTTLGTGLRLQKNRIAIGDHLDTSAPDYAGWQTEHITFSNQQTNHALNLGLDFKANTNQTFYTRLGTGFRYPNIDDRIGGSGGTSLELNTQTSKDFEVGIKFNSKDFFANLSLYRIEGKNELAYDTDAFENINMNSTKRYGFELDTNYKISNKINFKNNFTFAKAHYTSGDQGSYATDFKDNDVPLVPPYSIDSIISWKVLDFTEISSYIKYQDEMRMESDDENFQPKIPSYVIANIAINSKVGDFLANLNINNVFNETYYNYAVASSSTKGTYNAYPLPGREIIFTLGKEF